MLGSSRKAVWVIIRAEWLPTISGEISPFSALPSLSIKDPVLTNADSMQCWLSLQNSARASEAHTATSILFFGSPTST